jgi:hypothetical protein
LGGVDVAGDAHLGEAEDVGGARGGCGEGVGDGVEVGGDCAFFAPYLDEAKFQGFHGDSGGLSVAIVLQMNLLALLPQAGQ